MEKVYYPLLSNEGKIERIFGKEYLEKSKSDILTVKEVLEANDYLCEVLYGKELANLIKNRKIDQVNELYFDVYNRVVKLTGPIEQIDINNIGVLLIRPETLGIGDQYLKFLQSKGLTTLLDREIIVTFQQYWMLYHHGLVHYDCRYDFPTRTLNYIDNKCRLLVVSGDREKFGFDSISSYLKSIKGKHGSFSAGTLRGDIAFNGLKDTVCGENKFSSEVNVVLDPIGAYRILTRGQINSDRCHEEADIPLLFYSGQAVHIPDDDEIKRDLSVLCGEDDLKVINEKTLVLKK